MNKHPKEHDPEHPGQGLASEATEGAAAGDAQSGDFQAMLEAKDKEIAELKDKYLRALADGENARKRIRQQSEESVRIQKEELLRDLLPIVDNLERAVEAGRTGSSDGQILQGVEMVLRSLHDFLKGKGVTPIPSAGHPFDPSRHEAIDQVASDTHPANTVVQEFHKGYLIGDRILRPARVTVAKGPEDGRSNGESGNSRVEKN